MWFTLVYIQKEINRYSAAQQKCTDFVEELWTQFENHQITTSSKKVYIYKKKDQ